MYNNLLSTDFYVEKYKNIKINVSATSNANGVLTVDEFNNSLYSTIHVGFQQIKSLYGYTALYTNYLLLYDDSQCALIKDFTTPNQYTFTINPNKPVYYKLDARKHTVTQSSNSNQFQAYLAGRTIFKVILNNIELKPTQYSYALGYLTLNTQMDDFENTVQVIHYATDQTHIGTFTLLYEGVQTRFDIESGTCTQDFFNDMYNIKSFGEFSDTLSKSFDEYSNSTPNSMREQVTYDFKGSFNLTQYIGQDDIVAYVGRDMFRVVGYDFFNDIMYQYVGCKVYNPNSMSNSKSVSTKSVEVVFTDRITIIGSNGIAYGDGNYGDGFYGGSVKVRSELFDGGFYV